MKPARLITIVLLLAALTLSACSMALPGAAVGLDRLTGGLASPTAGQSPTAAPPAAAPAASANDLQTALEQVYQAVNPSVVNIQVMLQASMSGLDQLPSLPFQFGPGDPDQQLPQVTPQQGLGSGFVWDRQGHIVTNNHVVDGATKVTVTFSDGLSLPAQVVGRDPDSDLAVVKVDPARANLQPVTLADSTQVKVGQFAIAIGNPFGLEGSMSFGIVSALGRTLPAGNESSTMTAGGNYTIPDIIQTDAPVNPGNSGGVLLDLQGNLIGVPTAIESAVRSSAGVGFAVPSVIVRKVVPELIETGSFTHPYIGISGRTLTSDLAQAMDLSDTQRGALVIDVTQDSPADKAGLVGSSKQVEVAGAQLRVGGDVITGIGGQPVRDFEDLTTYLARYGRVGGRVEATVLRDGKETTVTLTLAARPATRAQAEATQPGTPVRGGAWLGISGVTVTPELARAAGLPEDQAGALVQTVVSGSPAEKVGLRGGSESATVNGQTVMVGGDVIVAVDGKAVESMPALASAVQARQPGDQVELKVLREGEQVVVQVTLAARPASSR